MDVRAKFRVTSVTIFGGSTSGQVDLSAVTADEVEENRRFHKYTPSGNLKMSIDNPPVFEAFKSMLGKTYYLDFTPAE